MASTGTSESDDAVDPVAAERARRRKLLALTLMLLIGLPVYLIAASWLATVLNPVIDTPDGPVRALHWTVEMVIYIVLGVLWALPLKSMVQGVGRAAPK
ncbi:MAG: DUF2842 domain-containing protein [Pseudomonadota bacterium]